MDLHDKINEQVELASLGYVGHTTATDRILVLIRNHLGSDEAVERASRVIDPGSWAVLDSYYEQRKRKYSDAHPFKLTDGMKVARGGSFNTRPMQARSAFRQAYPSWQKVFDVGFRVIMLPDPPATAAR